MGPLKRAFSSILLAGGIVTILAGLSATFGFTTGGFVTSIALVAALLYAGGLWFGGSSQIISAPGADVVIVFDRSLRVTAGPAPGASVMMQFPEPLRSEIEMRCRLALRGEHTHFECEHAGARLAFDVAPIQSIQGVVMYGVLISGSGLIAPAAATAPLTTVA
ncbi:MAG TPA: hypothetical protein VL882_21890 [Vicinamibacterales bacterium]|jgi:hypothetical protein|nr:hypothetical protein [Vicinamibacterales bacterium]